MGEPDQKAPPKKSDLAVRVKKAEAERVRQKLVSRGLFDSSRSIERDANCVVFPVLAKPKGIAAFKASLPLQKEKNQSLERRLSQILPRESFSKSFDIVGTVGILDVPKLSKENQKFAAEALRQVYPSLTCVCTRAGTIEDEFRVRPLKRIWGKSSLTTHNENGVRLRLDPGKVYFSPRQASERLRIEKLVGKEERILVMFAGCGPYSILIARKHPDCFVFSVEKNPAGVRYLKGNIKLNSVSGNSKALLGDVRKIVPKLGKFERILMPLPKDAGSFLDIALLASKPGTVIHLYSFGRDPSEGLSEIKSKIPGSKILNSQKCGDIAPGKFRLVYDILVQ